MSKSFTRGDIVQLITPVQGRRFIGKILKEINGCYQVGLPNSLYVIFPKENWELCDKSAPLPDNISDNSDDIENN